MHKLEEFLKGEKKICVVGLGYVGLPLAVLLSTKFKVIGYDINQKRIEELKQKIDKTGEVEGQKLSSSKVEFTSNPRKISEADVVMIAVPTPLDKENRPDLTITFNATRTIAKNLKKGAIIVYESTFYPGFTEECLPLIELESGLKHKSDFWVGYSPERVNPGDKEHTIDKISKVVSGDCQETKDFLAALYGEVISAGIHKAPDIKTAEAAKVIENTQRDVNIAFMNEISRIFNKMNINTKEVLKAAGTKWNFLKFEPGLVGGHCISVDPYYLISKSESLGCKPEFVLKAREINENMGKYIALSTIENLSKLGKSPKQSKILLLGITFKEDIRDIRNTKVMDIYNELKRYQANIFVYDPYADKEEVKGEYGIELIDNFQDNLYDSIIIAVKHDMFKKLGIEKLKALGNGDKIALIDIKGLFPEARYDKSILYWSL